MVSQYGFHKSCLENNRKFIISPFIEIISLLVQRRKNKNISNNVKY